MAQKAHAEGFSAQLGVADERGQAAFLAVFLLIPVFLGLTGLAFAYGTSVTQYRAAQAAADAAALAGAADLPCPVSGSCSATTDAQTYATANGFTNGTNSVTVTVNIPPASGIHQGDTQSIEVIINEPLTTQFLGSWNQTVTVKARSVATAFTPIPPCVICVLSSNASQAFYASGNARLTVHGGPMVVDSNQTNAAALAGSSIVTDSSGIKVVGSGSHCTSIGGTSSFSPTATCGIAPLADPFAGVPVPSVSGLTHGAVSFTSGNNTIDPGIYTSISVTNIGQLTMNPGTYVITGPVGGSSSALNLGNSGVLTANGVTIYFTCALYPIGCLSIGQAGAGVNIGGNATFTITAPTSGTYAGLAIFYDPHNTQSFSISNGGTGTLIGSVYAKSAPVTLQGGSAANQLDAIFASNTLTLGNSALLTITFDPTKNYQIGLPAIAASLTE